MDINLNKKLLSKEDLLTNIADIDIYRFYTEKEVSIGGKKILSPLRTESDPSFGYFLGSGGEICFNDFLLGGGDCIRFVELLFGLNFYEALSKIAVDFNKESNYYIKKVDKTSKDYDPKTFEDRENLLSRANNFRLGKSRRDWKAYDYVFWLQFGIDAGTLAKYHVEPINYIFINGKPIKADKYAYVFIEYKDGKETYKIYQPFNKQFKWLNNHNNSIWQGWSQLPEDGSQLIITKSLKDVMAIDSLLGVPAVSLQSESTAPKEHIIKELKNRFVVTYLLYDNDFDKDVNWGRKFGNGLAEEFYLLQIEIPEIYKSKDISDLVKNHGADEAKKILKGLTSVPY